ncbi:MAG: DNA translocase FtsK, partial [Opitutaceae bacterium]|nr:DNA translocase FtsK [Opitutaceae bacterium]
MPKPETSNSNDGPSAKAPRYQPNWPIALSFLLVGVFIAVALVAYDPLQSSHISTAPRPKNPMGWIGAESIYILLFSLGASTWLIPVFFGWIVYLAIKAGRHLTGTRIVTMVIAIAAFSGLWSMVDFFKFSNYFPSGPGGYIGKGLYEGLLHEPAGPIGSALMLGVIYTAAMLYIFTRDIGTEIDRIYAGFTAWREARAKQKAALAAELAKEREARAKQKAAASVAVSAAAPLATNTPTTPVGPSGGKKTFAAKSAEDPL